MKWSWKLGTFAGIPVNVHATFLLLLIWIGASHWLRNGNLSAVAAGVAFTSTIFLCVILHEFGHALMARRFGIRTKEITLLPIGGLAQLERIPSEPRQELWIALAGPAVNVAIAAALGLYLLLVGHIEPLVRLGLASGNFVERLFVANVFLVGFNLIPAFPMDGGRVLRALLATRWDHLRATRAAAGIGQTLAFAFGLWGLFTNPFLVFIALFVWIGATQEAAHVEMKSSLRGVPVKDAMIGDFRTISPDDDLSKAVEIILSGWQQDFPVVAKGRVVGLLTRSDLIAKLASVGLSARIREAMRKDFPVADPADSLEAVFSRLQESETRAVPILRGGQLLGLLTLDNLTEYLLIRAAIKAAGDGGQLKQLSLPNSSLPV